MCCVEEVYNVCNSNVLSGVSMYLDHLNFYAVCTLVVECMSVVVNGSKRHSLQTVELSQWFQAAVQIVSNLPAPSNGGPIYRFLGMPAMRTRWMAGAAAHKTG